MLEELKEKYTEEELNHLFDQALHYAEWQRRKAAYERTEVAETAVRQHIKATGDREGTISCPVCQTGILTYDRNVFDRTACSTPGCVSWSSLSCTTDDILGEEPSCSS